MKTQHELQTVCQYCGAEWTLYAEITSTRCPHCKRESWEAGAMFAKYFPEKLAAHNQKLKRVIAAKKRAVERLFP